MTFIRTKPASERGTRASAEESEVPAEHTHTEWMGLEVFADCVMLNADSNYRSAK